MKPNLLVLFFSLRALLSFNALTDDDLKHFNIGIGGGIFSETLESPLTKNQDFSGLQANAGVGYNWEYAALDAGVGI